MCVGGKIHPDMDKIWGVNVSIRWMVLKYLYTVAICVNVKQLETDELLI